MPMSALYISDRVYQAVADASAEVGVFGHGYTYGGHPVACAVALEALQIYEERDIVGHVNQVAPSLQQGLQKFRDHPYIGDVRGMGLIAAVELSANPALRQAFPPERAVGAYLVRRAQEHGLILRAMAGDIVAFSPPLIITKAEIHALLERFERALDDTSAWIRTWSD
jgi:4-aminobutyrate--pyruvate transaminase